MRTIRSRCIKMAVLFTAASQMVYFYVSVTYHHTNYNASIPRFTSVVPAYLNNLRNSPKLQFKEGVDSTHLHSNTTVKAWCPDPEVTLVSAFFDIGDLIKGKNPRNVQEYYTWSRAFSRIHAPLVVYTDSEDFARHVAGLRSQLSPRLTHILRINRSALWSFQLKDAIGRLYAVKNYPKHAPNTVVPEYSCAMHSKYACLKDAISQRTELVTSRFVAWVDVGYFRDLARDGITGTYCVRAPKNLTEGKVLFNQVYNPRFKLKPRQIFYKNLVWVGGGCFVATRDTMVKFCDEYKRAATFFLFQRNLSSTDQQTLYASMTEEGRSYLNFTVEIAVNHGRHSLGTSLLQRP